MVRRSPWDDLVATGRRIELRRVRLPDRLRGGMAVPRGGWWAVFLDDRLLGPERRSVLAHELVHVEREGGPAYTGQPAAWDAVVARDEAAVDREVARRLVPADELEVWLAAQDGLGQSVGALELAEEFDCSIEVAHLALVMRSPGRPPEWMA